MQPIIDQKRDGPPRLILDIKAQQGRNRRLQDPQSLLMIIGVLRIPAKAKIGQIKHARGHQPVPVLCNSLGHGIERLLQESGLQALEFGDAGGVEDERVDLEEDVGAGGAPGAGDRDFVGGSDAGRERGGIARESAGGEEGARWGFAVVVADGLAAAEKEGGGGNEGGGGGG